MFVASIDYVFSLSLGIWENLLDQTPAGPTDAQRLLEYESRHHGEFGFYRIVFAGLSQADDPEIRAALGRMYRRFQRFIRRRIENHRELRGCGRDPAPDLAAWAFIGLGTVSNLAREFGLLPEERRLALMGEVGRLLLDGQRR